MPNCRKLLRQATERVARTDFCNDGAKSAANTAMMAMTTNISISVNFRIVSSPPPQSIGR